MSKRGAEEYITKEHGSTPNTSSEAAKVKMATAAQLAKRKMAVPKSRAGRTGQTPLPSASSSNPFASTNLFGASSNEQLPAVSNPGGFTFGASQSFPAGNTSSNSGFTFSVPGQSNSFTFGQPAPSNPFATLNGNTNTDTKGQQAQSQDSNDITMESPQKKPAFGATVFGANGVQEKPQSTGFSFGQPSSQQSSSPQIGFGNTPAAPLFGQTLSKPSETTTASNIFGQTSKDAATTSPTFGITSNTPESQVASNGFAFGQPTTTSAPFSTPAFGFGQTSNSTSSSAPAFSFGQPQTQPPSSAPLFGASSQASLPPFGSSVSASAPASTATGTTALFGSAPVGSTNNAFGGFGSVTGAGQTPTTENAVSLEQPKPSLFGQSHSKPNKDEPKPAGAVEQEQTKPNPFAGLFAQNKTGQTSTSSTAGSEKPVFSFAAPSQPSGLFASPKPEPNLATAKPAEDTPKKPLFGFGASTTTPSSTLFSASKPATEKAPTANPFAALSNATSGSPAKSADQPSFGLSKSTSSKDTNGVRSSAAFGQTSSSDTSIGPAEPASNMFGTSGESRHPPPAVTSTAGSPLKRVSDDPNNQAKTKDTALSGSAAPKPDESIKPATGFLGSAPNPLASASSTGQLSTKQSHSSASLERNVNTHPPTRIPPYLNGDDYKSYDSNYRLHSLNREFQKRIASLDPSREDFENIVRNYVAARESIGESIGLYIRNIAGMKRKPDDDGSKGGDDANAAKRSRSTMETPSQTKPAAGSSGPIFQPVPPSSSKSLSNSTSMSPVKATTSTASSTSSLFNSMIPSNQSTSLTSNDNPFASLSKSATTSNGDITTQPTFSFGKSASISAPVGSTTPTKSPPKKPAFEMPKFSAPVGGGNFLDAFKKQSEQSAIKFAKEAKEKRKAEEFDSDEDDEEEWNRKYEEEEQAKKAKTKGIAQTGFTPVFGNSTDASKNSLFGFGTSTNAVSATVKPASVSLFGAQEAGKSSDKPINISDNDNEEDSTDSANAEEDDGDDEEEEEEIDDDDLPEDEVNGDDDHDDDDLETTLAKSRSKGRSLFDRITPNPSTGKNATLTSVPDAVEKDRPTKSSAVGGLFGRGTPDAPNFSPLTPAGSNEPYVPSKTFNFTPTPPTTTPTPTPGASIFAGGLMKDGPITGEGLFGSRPSTPSNAEKPKSNLFGALGTPSSAAAGSDHTWKKGSEIKFGSSTADAPFVSITSPSPRKEETKSLANLFGPSSSTNDSSSTNNVGFTFGQSPAPGFLAATSHLVGGSGTTSGLSSRATSPGTTDNESVATNEEDYSNDTQVSLIESRPGEENENVIFESRARALRWYKQDEIEGTKLNQGWNVVGLGPARLLRHKQTGKTRLVMRAEPGANIILNTNLQPEISYGYVAAGTAGTVKFNVVTADGIQGWILKVKTQQQGQELAKLMEENKTGKA